MFCLKGPWRPGIQDPGVLRVGFLVPCCTQMFLGPGIQYPGVLVVRQGTPAGAFGDVFDHREAAESGNFGAGWQEYAIYIGWAFWGTL